MASDFPETESIPPMPTSPEHPEKLPPNIPIPGVPTFSNEERKFKCKICGKYFTSKRELQKHMATEHSQPKAKTKK